jgi:hypothetical protein
MVLAIEAADWIALAAVGATVVTVIVSAIVSYLLARNDRQHTERLAAAEQQQTRALARDDRMFDARRNAYEGMLQLLQHRWSTVKAFRLEAGMKEGSEPEPFTTNEREALRARLSLYAPDNVRRALTISSTCWATLPLRSVS